MKKETILLKIALILIGLPVLALAIYFIFMLASKRDELNPIYADIIYALLVIFYLMLIPFYFALFQAIQLLTLIDQDLSFSIDSINALKWIKYSAMAIILLGSIAMPFIYLIAELDDAPGLILFALIIPFGALIITLLAAILQKVLKNAYEIKTENELTV